jgi:hypothetical protein
MIKFFLEAVNFSGNVYPTFRAHYIILKLLPRVVLVPKNFRQSSQIRMSSSQNKIKQVILQAAVLFLIVSNVTFAYKLM